MTSVRYSGAGRARLSSLPLTVSGSASHHHHRGRDHVGRQPLGQLARACRPGPAGPGHIAHQALIAGAVLAGDHHRLLHPIQPGQCGLDLTELDAVPADLDLLIGAPQILQLPIGAATAPDPRCDTCVSPGRRRTDRPQTATRSTRPGANTHTPRRRRPHTTRRPRRPAPAATTRPAQKTPPLAPATPIGTTRRARHQRRAHRRIHRRLGRAIPLIITRPGAHRSTTSPGRPHRPNTNAADPDPRVDSARHRRRRLT